MFTTRPSTPTESGDWAATTTAGTQTVMYSHGATSLRTRKGSIGSIAISRLATVSAVRLGSQWEEGMGAKQQEKSTQSGPVKRVAPGMTEWDWGAWRDQAFARLL